MNDFKIRDTSLKILKNIYDCALDMASLHFSIPNEDLTIGIPEISESQLKLCMEYLNGTNLISSTLSSNNTSRNIHLKPQAIDLIEGA